MLDARTYTLTKFRIFRTYAKYARWSEENICAILHEMMCVRAVILLYRVLFSLIATTVRKL